MGKKCLVFDLDDTLVMTGAARPYMRTRKGREVVTEEIGNIETRLRSKGIAEIYNSYEREGRAVVITNSPTDYAEAVMRKHGLRVGRILGSAGKPLTDNTRGFLNQNIGNGPEEYLFVEDSAGGILVANSLGIASVGVDGGYSTEEQMMMAGAQRVVKSIGELEQAIKDFEKGEILYEKRDVERGTERMTKEEVIKARNEISRNEVILTSATTYTPYSRDKEISEESQWILDIKAGRDMTFEEMVEGGTRDYYAGGRVRKGKKVIESFNNLRSMVVRRISELGIKGKVLIVAAPNSLPEFCYRCDMNHSLAYNVRNDLMKQEGEEAREKYFWGDDRIVKRILPTEAAHSGGMRTSEKHYRTIGVRKLLKDPREVENVIIFDDVTTTGTQIESIARIMEKLGLEEAKFYGVTIGRTADR